jgi:hypothetical protein
MQRFCSNLANRRVNPFFTGVNRGETAAGLTDFGQHARTTRRWVRRIGLDFQLWEAGSFPYSFACLNY